MKKFILFIAFCGCVTTTFAGNIVIDGVNKRVDTLMHRTIGPGVTYSKLRLPDYPLSVYLMTVDLNNEHNKIETFQAQNQVGKTEAMTSAYNRLSRAEHRALGGVNANFWIVSGQGQPNELLGVSHSGSALDGQIVTDPNDWNRGRYNDSELKKQEIGFAVIDEAKKLWICDMAFDGKVKVGENSFAISEVNRNRVAPTNNQIVLFNQYLGTKATRTSTAGTEVVVELAAGQTWGTNKDIQCTVLSKNNSGGTTIQAGQAVLSGHGTGKTFLDQIAVGQTITLNMGVITRETNERPSVAQMVTGNAYVLRNGELTARNDNETYNSQTYPRTGIGASADGKKLFLIVIDKKNGVGANTALMCKILKAYGAHNVTTMDGGGSAQMMVGGKIVNDPADGKERAVANGWFVFNTAPEDNNVASLLFEEHADIIIPAYAEYTPNILAYNQYGTLLSENFQNYTLSCTPASLGTISADGKTFFAAATTAKGYLTATYGTITVNHPLEIVNGNIFIRLDSVLIDKRDYSIEVISTTGTKEMTIDPAKIQWTVRDGSVAAVTDGKLSGVKNGTTMVVGQLGEFKDSLKVTVEIADHSGLIVSDMSDIDNWKITAQKNWNATLSGENIPASWPHGGAVNYVYQTNRAPSLKLENELRLYSLPDSMKIYMNTGDIKVSKMFIGLHANNNKTVIQKTLENLPNGADVEIKIDFAELFDTKDLAIYPIWLEYISNQILVTSQTVGKAYAYAIRDIRLYYQGVPVGLNELSATSPLVAFPNPAKSGETIFVANNFDNKQVKAEIFSLDGRILHAQTVSANGAGLSFALPQMASGTYVLKLSSNKKNEIVKLVIK